MSLLLMCYITLKGGILLSTNGWNSKKAKQKQLRWALVNFVLYLNFLLINNFVYIRDEEINFTKL